MQIYWNKRKRLEFNFQRIGLRNQHGRRFIVLGHQYGRRDVMWKHSISYLALELTYVNKTHKQSEVENFLFQFSLCVLI